jgi:hypothetical protein
MDTMDRHRRLSLFLVAIGLLMFGIAEGASHLLASAAPSTGP